MRCSHYSNSLYLLWLQIETLVKQPFIIIGFQDYIRTLQQPVTCTWWLPPRSRHWKMFGLNPFTPELSVRHHRSYYIYRLGHVDLLLPVICWSASLFWLCSLTQQWGHLVLGVSELHFISTSISSEYFSVSYQSSDVYFWNLNSPLCKYQVMSGGHRSLFYAWRITWFLCVFV